jgi:Fe2+ or Zn2+ uptake regulation protein
MTQSTYPKCVGTTFELKDASGVSGANFAYSFIQCSSCGAVVGVTDRHHVPTLLNQIAAKLGFKLFQ